MVSSWFPYIKRFYWYEFNRKIKLHKRYQRNARWYFSKFSFCSSFTSISSEDSWVHRIHLMRRWKMELWKFSFKSRKFRTLWNTFCILNKEYKRKASYLYSAQYGNLFEFWVIVNRIICTSLCLRWLYLWNVWIPYLNLERFQRL